MAIDIIEVRKAAVGDAESAAAIWLESAETTAQVDPRYQIAPDSMTLWREAFLDRVADPNWQVLVATRRGRVMGCIMGTTQPNAPGLLPEQIGVVQELVIDSHGRGGGAGTQLFEGLAAWFRERGVTRIEVRVPVRGAIAQAFWRAAGATEWYDLMWIKLRD